MPQLGRGVIRHSQAISSDERGRIPGNIFRQALTGQNGSQDVFGMHIADKVALVAPGIATVPTFLAGSATGDGADAHVLATLDSIHTFSDFSDNSRRFVAQISRG